MPIWQHGRNRLARLGRLATRYFSMLYSANLLFFYILKVGQVGHGTAANYVALRRFIEERPARGLIAVENRRSNDAAGRPMPARAGALRDFWLGVEGRRGFSYERRCSFIKGAIAPSHRKSVGGGITFDVACRGVGHYRLDIGGERLPHLVNRLF